MDKILLIIGILVAIVILITGGFGLFRTTFNSAPGGGFSFFSSGPIASGPDGVGDSEDIVGVTPDESASPNSGRGSQTGGNVGSQDPKNFIEIKSVNRPSSGVKSPANEYIVIRHTGQVGSASVLISNWVVGNSQGKTYAVGTAQKLPFFDAAAGVALKPGEEAYIHTGTSPISQNFQENACTGYLNKTYSFIPSLQESCPRQNFRTMLQFKDACIQFLERNAGSCRTPAISQEDAIKIGNECVEYVNENLTYNGCVKTFRIASDFYRSRWHFYLSRPEKLWREVHDRITLYNDKGTVIDTFEY